MNGRRMLDDAAVPKRLVQAASPSTVSSGEQLKVAKVAWLLQMAGNRSMFSHRRMSLRGTILRNGQDLFVWFEREKACSKIWVEWRCWGDVLLEFADG